MLYNCFSKTWMSGLIHILKQGPKLISISAAHSNRNHDEVEPCEKKESRSCLKK